MPSCPECKSKKVWKDGFRSIQDTKVQRYLCRDCGFRFSDPEFSRKNNISNQPQKAPRQICATLTEGSKNLTRTEKNQVLRENAQRNKGQIISFAWHLKKQGRRETTIQTYCGYLTVLTKYCNLNDPDSVKAVLATHFTNRNTQRSVCCAYDSFAKYAGIQWEKPNYKLEHKQVFIPIEEELQIAINCGTRNSIIFSHFVYETGARVNEAERLEWSDINSKHNQITIKASKNGKSRTIPVSNQLIDRLLSLPKINNTVFPAKAKGGRQVAFRLRLITLERRYKNPRFRKIHYHTLRHCKALREYHKTHSMQHVKRILGHKSIETTQRYVDLYEELYPTRLKKTVCEIALNIQEAKRLIEQGFRYETGEYNDGGKLFYKEKFI